MRHTLQIYFLLAGHILILINCLASVEPPSNVKTIYPELTIQMRDVSPVTPVYIRYWKGRKFYTLGPSVSILTDINGNLNYSIMLSSIPNKAAVIIFLDINKDGTIGSNDLAYSEKYISFPSSPSNGQIKKVLELSEDSFTELFSAGPPEIAPINNASYICIFHPSDLQGWHKSGEGIKASGTILPLTDWIPTARFDTDSSGSVNSQSIQNTFLPGFESYSGICLIDTDKKDIFKYREYENCAEIAEFNITDMPDTIFEFKDCNPINLHETK
jgi:hypothetical protein